MITLKQNKSPMLSFFLELYSFIGFHWSKPWSSQTQQHEAAVNNDCQSTNPKYKNGASKNFEQLSWQMIFGPIKIAAGPNLFYERIVLWCQGPNCAFDWLTSSDTSPHASAPSENGRAYGLYYIRIVRLSGVTSCLKL